MMQFLECSIEQEEIIADHLLLEKQLVMVPTEKSRIVNFVSKKYPGAKIKSVNLDMENTRWEIDVDISPELLHL